MDRLEARLDALPTGLTLAMRSIRTYIAGLGTAASLTGAAVVAFIALGAVVAFNDLPSGSAEVAQREIDVAAPPPEAAAVMATAPAAAPAASPAPGATAVALASAPAAAPASTPALVSGAGAAPVGGTLVPPADGDLPAPASPAPSPPPGAPTPSPTGPGTLSPPNIRGGLDGTVEGVTGIDPGLGSVTGPLTDVVDDVLGKLKELGQEPGLGVPPPPAPAPPPNPDLPIPGFPGELLPGVLGG